MLGSHPLSVDAVQIWSTAEILAPGAVADEVLAVAGAEVGEVAVPDNPTPEAETVCITVAGGVRPVVWHTYPYEAPAAKEFPGTGTGPPQSVAGNDSELVTLMLLSASVPVLVTTTRHHTSEPYHVPDEAQSVVLAGVGSQEAPTGNVHTSTVAVMESVAADAGAGVHASIASRGSKSPAASDSRTRGPEFRLMGVPLPPEWTHVEN